MACGVALARAFHSRDCQIRLCMSLPILLKLFTDSVLSPKSFGLLNLGNPIIWCIWWKPTSSLTIVSRRIHNFLASGLEIPKKYFSQSRRLNLYFLIPRKVYWVVSKINSSHYASRHYARLRARIPNGCELYIGSVISFAALTYLRYEGNELPLSIGLSFRVPRWVSAYVDLGQSTFLPRGHDILICSPIKVLRIVNESFVGRAEIILKILRRDCYLLDSASGFIYKAAGTPHFLLTRVRSMTILKHYGWRKSRDFCRNRK